MNVFLMRFSGLINWHTYTHSATCHVCDLRIYWMRGRRNCVTAIRFTQCSTTSHPPSAIASCRRACQPNVDIDEAYANPRMAFMWLRASPRLVPFIIIYAWSRRIVVVSPPQSSMRDKFLCKVYTICADCFNSTSSTVWKEILRKQHTCTTCRKSG